jgi:hypothetical protein
MKRPNSLAELVNLINAIIEVLNLKKQKVNSQKGAYDILVEWGYKSSSDQLSMCNQIGKVIDNMNLDQETLDKISAIADKKI